MFDPLAVLLLVAANQSLLRRFPVKPLPPEEVLDLEKPDDETIDLRWNDSMSKKAAHTKMESATEQLKEWKDKLEQFNLKVPQPTQDNVEIVQTEEPVPHIDLKGQKKTEDKEIIADNDGFDLDEVAIDMQTETVPPKLFEQEPITTTVEEALKMPEAESVVTPIDERIKPDFTEVIEPETVRKVPVADMDKLAPEVEVGEFESGYRPKAVKKSQERILKDAYVQNEEQTDNTLWKKSQKRLTTEENYRIKIEQRIAELMDKLDAGEIELNDLTPEDRQVIIDIRMQNETGDNLKN